MGKSPDTSSITTHNGRTKVTIPKPIADALDLTTGQKVKWRIVGKGRLECVVIPAGSSPNKNEQAS